MNTKPVLLQVPSVVFEFSKAFNTRKIADKKQEGAKGKADDEIGSKASEDVSTEESVFGGILPSAEWTAEADETGDLRLYANKFDCFQSMLEQLVVTHGCVIRSQQLHKLPKLYRCKRHLLLDGNPRCLAVVEVELQGRTFYILEVDTSDGVCSLSTLLLRLKSSLDWPKQLTLLAEELTQKSLHWPSQRLKMLCGKDGYSGIPHPQIKSVDKGKLHEESIEHWAARFHSWMTSI
ncbi:Tn7-like element transposition protein TnsE [Edwardsiella tarda]|uniref:Tn7-like element transposition protein TnsE n=1 Tax=Edwardsiella tarda TaxID=636 RepID=UPI00351C002D